MVESFPEGHDRVRDGQFFGDDIALGAEVKGLFDAALVDYPFDDAGFAKIGLTFGTVPEGRSCRWCVRWRTSGSSVPDARSRRSAVRAWQRPS